MANDSPPARHRVSNFVLARVRCFFQGITVVLVLLSSSDCLMLIAKSTGNMEIPVKQKIIRAYRKLLRHDFYLLQVAANERSITHKFAEYLQREFPSYNVDCEYNRIGNDTKKLDGLLSELKKVFSESKKEVPLDDEDATTVFPDIIVHHRGTQNNLLVIEAKKDVKKDPKDERKLTEYKNQLGYQHAYSVTFPTGQKVNDFRESQIDGFITPV
jgi:hypothetical protein